MPVVVAGLWSSRYAAELGRSSGAGTSLGIVAWKLVDPPGDNDALELRYGALVAGVFVIVLFTCASGVANAPLRRKLPQRSYQAPPPPPAYEPGV